MPGQRIYYVPPRMVGSLRDWSGMDSADGASWLLDHAEDLGFNAVWFSPMCQTTSFEKVAHGKLQTGSYYAIRDHFSYDPEFSAGGNDEDDLAHMRHFCAAAKAKGLRVYADLVFNHVAADHPLVMDENREIANILARAGGGVHPVRGHKNKVIGLSYIEDGAERVFHFRFRRDANFSLQFGGPAEDPWTDVAQVNYSSPEARRFFITGDRDHKAYFKQVIDWHLDQGVTGFRCDAAYLIPPEAWAELIAYAKDRQPDLVTLAETLCTTQHKVERMAQARMAGDNGNDRPVFDLGMLGIYWWNFVDGWLPEGEHPRLQAMSRYGGAGSPDTHDTEGTLAGNLRKEFNRLARADGFIAEACLRDYAVSVLACNSAFMQMGYEYCNEKQNGVFRGSVSPEDWKTLREKNGETALDISSGIRALNTLKDRMDVANCRVTFDAFGTTEEGRLAVLRCSYVDVDTGSKKAGIALLLDRHPEHGAMALPESVRRELESEGMQPSDPALKTVHGFAVWHSPCNKTHDNKPANVYKPRNTPRL